MPDHFRCAALASIARQLPAAGLLIRVALAAACSTVPSATVKEIYGPPTVRTETLTQIAPKISVIPDPRVFMVPNVGIIEGRDAVLVVDTGLGAANGKRIFDRVVALAKGRRIYVTTTHFHPEHSFGAAAFPRETYILNKAQADEQREKGAGNLERFKTRGPDISAAVQNTVVAEPGEIFTGRKVIDLGGLTVELRETPGHTRGDQIVYVQESGVLFAGDLVEDRFFPILADVDASGARWSAVLDELLALNPKIVVPGHGAIGDKTMIRKARDFLNTMRADVKASVRRGEMQDQVVSTLKAKYRAKYADWDNGNFLPLSIARIYAEERGIPPQLPPADPVQ